jgi:hypothetical protein
MPNTQADVVIKINNNQSNEGSVVCLMPNSVINKLVPEINKQVSRSDYFTKLQSRFKEEYV